MAAEGARVVVSDRDGPGAEVVAAAILRAGGEAHPVACDVSSPSQVEFLYAQAQARYGRLDYSFANAGFALAGMAHELTAEHFEEVLAVDVTGAVRCTQTAYRRMREQGGGHLVNTASLAGLVGFPGMLPYSTAKAAVVRYSLDLRQEARVYGVKVIALCPAFLQTRLFEACRTVNLDIQQVKRALPLPIEQLQPAVRALLRGVDRNQAIVTYPWYATALWWLSRASLTVAQPLTQLILKSVQSGTRST